MDESPSTPKAEPHPDVEPASAPRNKGGRPRTPRTVAALVAHVARSVLAEVEARPQRSGEGHPDASFSHASAPPRASTPGEAYLALAPRADPVAGGQARTSGSTSRSAGASGCRQRRWAPSPWRSSPCPCPSTLGMGNGALGARGQPVGAGPWRDCYVAARSKPATERSSSRSGQRRPAPRPMSRQWESSSGVARASRG